MLFYVQMRWNYQNRLSQEQLWEKEALEGEHGLAGLRSGMVRGLYKVVSQHRVIAIVDVDSLEDLDRNSMGWLPMREYLDFEHVWALRDYAGFIDDVRMRFPQPAAAQTTPAASSEMTRQVASRWFGLLAQGDLTGALQLVAEQVVWDNISATPGVTDLAPWLGSYRGLPAVIESFEVWASHSRMLTMELQDLVVEGEQAVALVHEHAQCLANQQEYDLAVSTRLKVNDGKICHWQALWDPSPLVCAYRR